MMQSAFSQATPSHEADGVQADRHESAAPHAHPTAAGDRDSLTLAFLPWGNVIEDFLDTIGVSLESFCNEFTGSYIFRYVEALKKAGVRTVLICVSVRVVKISQFTHRPTGATIYLVPALKVYKTVRSKMLNPYGHTVKDAFGKIRGARWLLFPALSILKEVVLFLTTPLKPLYGILQSEQCSAILCQEYEYPRFDVCVLLGWLNQLPVFATFQGGDYQRSRLERFVRPVTLRACEGLIIASQSEVRRVQARYGISTVNVARIFNPIDLHLWQGIPRDEARAPLGIPPHAGVVAWHGRISIWKKGLDILLEAWEQVCSQRPDRDLRLILVGTGQDAEKFSQRLAALGKTKILWLNEFLHDPLIIKRYLSAANVYAFPSRHEGFPVAPLEAMGCGLPIAAAEVQGIPDILAGGELSGGIIVPRESATELASAVGRLLDDEPWSRELGMRARQRVENYFSLEAVGHQLRDFLFSGRPAN